jgi:hypothetical protein
VDRDRGPRPVTYVEAVPPAPVVTAAGSAVVTAVKLGRSVSRAGWDLARRLPGGAQLERELQRVQRAAISELRRALEVAADPDHPGLSADERRGLLLIPSFSAGWPIGLGLRPAAGPGSLRAAMGELLARSADVDQSTSRESLYGTILGQLVPDEARIIAALADGRPCAVIDVVAKRFGSRSRTVVATASSVGPAAGVITIEAVPAYLTRLHGFGLVAFGPEDDQLRTQYETLATKPTVRAAEASIQERGLGGAHQVRRSVTLSELGRQFWAATEPARPALPRGRT